MPWPWPSRPWRGSPRWRPRTRNPADGDDATAYRRAYDWHTRHPNHPGAGFLVAPTGAGGTTGGLVPTPVQGPVTTALLLPLSGPQQSVGAAVRDGFLAAVLAQPDPGPRVLVYDTAMLGPAQAYQKALADGANIVVGPLTRDDVAALVPAQPLAVPRKSWSVTDGSRMQRSMTLVAVSLPRGLPRPM